MLWILCGNDFQQCFRWVADRTGVFCGGCKLKSAPQNGSEDWCSENCALWTSVLVGDFADGQQSVSFLQYKNRQSSIMQPVIATGSRFFVGILCGQRIKYTSSRSSKIMAALLCCAAKVDADRFSVGGESSVI